MEPTDFDIEAYIYALESYRDYEPYGHLPYEGALRDQPWVWKLAVDVVKSAIDAARAQARAEARQKD